MTARELDVKLQQAKQLTDDPEKSIGLRGRGLAHIVCSWTDELHFEDIPKGGIRVRAVKNLATDEDGAMTGFMSIEHNGASNI